ncbi:hypothetical protein JCM10213_003795 [Rhodosporidiobolus nylandii]
MPSSSHSSDSDAGRDPIQLPSLVLPFFAAQSTSPSYTQFTYADGDLSIRLYFDRLAAEKAAQPPLQPIPFAEAVSLSSKSGELCLKPAGNLFPALLDALKGVLDTCSTWHATALPPPMWEYRGVISGWTQRDFASYARTALLYAAGWFVEGCGERHPSLFDSCLLNQAEQEKIKKMNPLSFCLRRDLHTDVLVFTELDADVPFDALRALGHHEYNKAHETAQRERQWTALDPDTQHTAMRLLDRIALYLDRRDELIKDINIYARTPEGKEHKTRIRPEGWQPLVVVTPTGGVPMLRVGENLYVGKVERSFGKMVGWLAMLGMMQFGSEVARKAELDKVVREKLSGSEENLDAIFARMSLSASTSAAGAPSSTSDSQHAPASSSSDGESDASSAATVVASTQAN